MVDADGGFPLDHIEFALQAGDSALAIFQSRRRRMLTNCDSSTGGINQAYCLVRQLPRRNVTMRQTCRRLERFVKQVNAVMLFQNGCETPDHQDGLGFAGLFHLDHLKAAGQGGVFLNIFFILRPCRRSDGAQRAASKSGLKQVGRVALSGGTSSSD